MASNDKDILGKADALLRRHSLGAPATGSDTGGVPVLTDLVGETAKPAAPESPAAPDVAKEVFAQVMADIEDRLVVDLERRLMRHLAPQVHAAVSAAMGELHQQLADAVAKAVAQALEARQIK